MNKAEIAELVGLVNFGRKQKAAGRDGVIVSSHPLVSRVGANILRGGGNAMDAALAAAVAQTVVEPHMSTIFGVLSLMHYDAKSGKTSSAGSPSIGLIPNCVQNAVNILDFGMEIEASVHTPRFGRAEAI